MKVGDLVRCVWQPRGSGVDRETQCVLPMKHTIKGEIGLIVRQFSHYHVVLFPALGYEHSLSTCAIEVISESR